MLTRELRQQAATQALERESHLRMAVFVDAETGREHGFLIVTVAVRGVGVYETSVPDFSSLTVTQDHDNRSFTLQ